MNTNRKWTSSTLLRLLTAMLLGCMLLGLCAHALAGETYFNSHWMSYIPDYVPISQINIPGTHDTGTYRTAHVFGDYMAECQEWTIRGQLYEGIRVLDIRLLGDSSWEEMKIRHGEGPFKGCNFYKGKDSCDKTYLRFKHVFEVVDAFLAANPTETIIMYATDEDDKEMAQARLRELSQKLKHDRPWDPAQKWNRFRWYFFGDDVPTLGEVRGQCVIISDCYFDGGNRIRPFTKFEDHCQVKDSAKFYWLDKAEIYAPYQSWAITQKFVQDKAIDADPIIREPQIKFVFSSTNTSGKDLPFGHGPEYWAERINPKIQKYYLQQDGKRYGWFFMDYPWPSNIDRVIKTNYYPCTFTVEWNDDHNAAGLRPKTAEEFLQKFRIEVIPQSSEFDRISITHTEKNADTTKEWYLLSISYDKDKDKTTLAFGFPTDREGRNYVGECKFLLYAKDDSYTVSKPVADKYAFTAADASLSESDKTWVEKVWNRDKYTLTPITSELPFRVYFDDLEDVAKLRPSYIGAAIAGHFIEVNQGNGQYVDFSDHVELTNDSAYKGTRVYNSGLRHGQRTDEGDMFSLKFENLPGNSNKYRLTTPRLPAAVAQHYKAETRIGSDGVWEIHFKLQGENRSTAWLIWEDGYTVDSHRLQGDTLEDFNKQFGFNLDNDPLVWCLELDPNYGKLRPFPNRFIFDPDLNAHLIGIADKYRNSAQIRGLKKSGNPEELYAVWHMNKDNMLEFHMTHQRLEDEKKQSDNEHFVYLRFDDGGAGPEQRGTAATYFTDGSYRGYYTIVLHQYRYTDSTRTTRADDWENILHLANYNNNVYYSDGRVYGAWTIENPDGDDPNLWRIDLVGLPQKASDGKYYGYEMELIQPAWGWEEKNIYTGIPGTYGPNHRPMLTMVAEQTLNVTLNWKDSWGGVQDPDKIRPDKVHILCYTDNSERQVLVDQDVPVVTKYKSESDYFTFRHLPRYTEGGNPIQNVVVEVSTPLGYTVCVPTESEPGFIPSEKQTVAMTKRANFIMQPRQYNVTVQIKWEGLSDEDTLPDEVKVYMTNAERTARVKYHLEFPQRITNQKKNWKAEFLPVSYAWNVKDKVVETNFSATSDDILGFTKDVSHVRKENGDVEVTVTYIAGTSKAIVHWLCLPEEIPQDRVDNGVKIFLAEEKRDRGGARYPNINTPIYDIHNKPCIRTVEGHADSTEWTYTLNEIIRIDPFEYMYVRYGIGSDPAPKGFVKLEEIDDQMTYHVYYIKGDNTMDVEVVWEDGNETANRPMDVTLDLLYRIDGSGEMQVADQFQLSSQNPDQVQDPHLWKTTLPNLRSVFFDEDGKMKTVEYAIDGEDLEDRGYMKTVTPLDTKEENREIPGYRVTYSLRESYQVKVVWADDGASASHDPLVMKLIKKLGDDKTEVVKTLELNAGNGWQGSFGKVSKYDASGNPIAYGIEAPDLIDEKQPYIGSGKLDEETNTFVVTYIQLIDSTTTVEWWDINEGDRPPELSFVLTADGEPVEKNAQETPIPQKITAEEWNTTGLTIEKLPAYRVDDEGIITKIDYLVETELPTGWPPQYSYHIFHVGEYDLKVVYAQIGGSIPVSVVWRDGGEDLENLRPDDVLIELKYQLTESTQQTLETADQIDLYGKKNEHLWNTAFDNLPAKWPVGDRFEEVTYVVDGPVPTGYMKTVSYVDEEGKDPYQGFVIDYMIPQNFKVRVDWVDGGEQGARKDIEVPLMDGNDEVQKLTLKADNGWSSNYTWVPKYDKTGALINYTITATDVPGYMKTVLPCENDVFVIRYIKLIDSTTNVDWRDNDNENGRRPNALSFVLMADGVPVAANVSGEAVPTTITQNDGWKVTVSDLPVYQMLEDGNFAKIDYTVDTQPLAGASMPYYRHIFRESNTANYTVVYTLTGKSVKASVNWLDGNDEQHHRPGSVTLTLTGPFVEVRDVDASQDWMTVFEGLPEVFTDSNGVEHPLNIEDLRVEGEEIENYVLSIIHPAVDEYVLNYTLANRKLTVQVVWDDKNNVKKIRPAVVEADLYADGTLYIKGTRITEEDGWVYPYEELPAYAEDSDQSQSARSVPQHLIYYQPIGYSIPGYVNTTIEQDGDLVYLVYKLIPDIPVTGDNNHPIANVFFGLLSLGLVGMLMKKRHKH